MLKETEEELLRSAQTGNIAAFERLVRLLERRMLAVAAGFAHTPDDANDIFQDAMLAAYRVLPNFKLESKFSTWLHKIVVNTALSNRRKLKRTWQKMAAEDDDGDIVGRGDINGGGDRIYLETTNSDIHILSTNN
ncbi:MAG TPA: sigma-70 family RNA polymerase sigma factor [Gammaproteobacteria bacterium]|nr:sigma-70 family RNA polymerase sigma factor [Gammaproteobacteria bacterium]